MVKRTITTEAINFIGALLIFGGIPIFILHKIFGVNLKTSIMIGAAIAALPAMSFGSALYDQIKWKSQSLYEKDDENASA